MTSQPKGKWYCPDCAPKMKHRRRGWCLYYIYWQEKDIKFKIKSHGLWCVVTSKYELFSWGREAHKRDFRTMQMAFIYHIVLFAREEKAIRKVYRYIILGREKGIWLICTIFGMILSFHLCHNLETTVRMIMFEKWHPNIHFHLPKLKSCIIHYAFDTSLYGSYLLRI